MDGAGFAQDWTNWPAVTAFRCALDAADDGAGVEAAVRDFFAEPQWARATLAALAFAARRHAGFSAPFAPFSSGVQQGFVLIDDPKVTVALVCVGADALAASKMRGGGRGSIGFEGAVTLYRFLDGGGARVGRWQAPEIDAMFDAGDAPVCRRVGDTRLDDGAWLRIDGRWEGFIVEAAERDLLFLQAQVKPGRATLRVEYDAERHGFIGATAADPADSHAQMLLTLLRLTDRRDAAPLVARWVDHPSFFLRWHAARELLTLDEAAGSAAIAQLAHDPHPDVAAAAQAALAHVETSACLA